MKGTKKPKSNKYRCKHCGKVVKRDSSKAWIRSICEETGLLVHLQKVKPISR